ncbi:hypothetical protein Csa_008686 [Cucumis sativus]|uniref:Uncharacterized protein n=1 Tax=Cucumis sativus TaxID=3659 RepID=A0A0A0KN94_CUCSA|nr:hypothetical protein Csa_008686 [Cucumis sativus]
MAAKFARNEDASASTNNGGGFDGECRQRRSTTVTLSEGVAHELERRRRMDRKKMRGDTSNSGCYTSRLPVLHLHFRLSQMKLNSLRPEPPPFESSPSRAVHPSRLLCKSCVGAAWVDLFSLPSRFLPFQAI